MNCSMLGAPAARMCFGTCRSGWGRSGQGGEAGGGSRLQASGCVWPRGLGCGPRTFESMPPNRNLE